MKTARNLFMTMCITLFTAFQVLADGVSPATGERTSVMPFIIGIVALVLILAFAWLTWLSKKNKK